jgi:hypothetical protein
LIYKIHKISNLHYGKKKLNNEELKRLDIYFKNAIESTICLTTHDNIKTAIKINKNIQEQAQKLQEQLQTIAQKLK